MVDRRRRYGLRSGAEGSIEEFVDGHRGRRCRHRDLAKRHVQHVLTALAMPNSTSSACTGSRVNVSDHAGAVVIPVPGDHDGSLGPQARRAGLRPGHFPRKARSAELTSSA
ncbi:hypothetical protein [Streptomyces adustus]